MRENPRRVPLVSPSPRTGTPSSGRDRCPGHRGRYRQSTGEIGVGMTGVWSAGTTILCLFNEDERPLHLTPIVRHEVVEVLWSGLM